MCCADLGDTKPTTCSTPTCSSEQCFWRACYRQRRSRFVNYLFNESNDVITVVVLNHDTDGRVRDKIQCRDQWNDDTNVCVCDLNRVCVVSLDVNETHAVCANKFLACWFVINISPYWIKPTTSVSRYLFCIQSFFRLTSNKHKVVCRDIVRFKHEHGCVPFDLHFVRFQFHILWQIAARTCGSSICKKKISSRSKRKTLTLTTSSWRLCCQRPRIGSTKNIYFKFEL